MAPVPVKKLTCDGDTNKRSFGEQPLLDVIGSDYFNSHCLCMFYWVAQMDAKVRVFHVNV